MELTERERRILAELESQLPAGESRRSGRIRGAKPVRWHRRPRWMVMSSAVLGVLLLAAGAVLDVGNAVLMGTLLLGWWLYPSTPTLRRVAGRWLRALAGEGPPRPPHGTAH